MSSLESGPPSVTIKGFSVATGSSRPGASVAKIARNHAYRPGSILGDVTEFDRGEHNLDSRGLHGSANHSRPVSIGTIVWLSSELMFFAALFAMYFTLRAVNPGVSAETELLNIPFASINTTILVVQRPYQLGVRRRAWRRQGLRRWFITTFLMGSVFIGGQVWEYAELVHEGLT